MGGRRTVWAVVAVLLLSCAAGVAQADGLTVTANTTIVAPAGTVTLQCTVPEDRELGDPCQWVDDAVTVTWSASAGSFRPAQDTDSGSDWPASTTWTAPTACGTYTIEASAVPVDYVSPAWLGPKTGTISIIVGATLTVTLPSGAATAGAEWSVDGTNWNASGASLVLAPGSYTISFNTVTGWTSPQSQQVTLTGGAATSETGNYVQQGNLTVTLLPAGAVTAGAQWSVDGTNWNASGASLYLAPGNYTVYFNTVAGWTSPQSQQVTVTAGETTSVTGTYVQQGSLTVTLGPSDAVTAGAKWSVDYGATWNASGATLTLDAGSYTVIFNIVTGWNSPQSQQVTVTSDETTSATGTYLPPGNLTITANTTTVVVGGTVTLQCTVPEDSDQWTPCMPPGDDAVTVTWSAWLPPGAPPAGSFSPPQDTNSGSDWPASTTWTAPTTPGVYTIKASAVPVDYVSPEWEIMTGTISITVVDLADLQIDDVSVAGTTQYFPYDPSSDVIVTAVLTPSAHASDLPDGSMIWTSSHDGADCELDELDYDVSQASSGEDDITCKAGPHGTQLGVTIDVEQLVHLQINGQNVEGTKQYFPVASGSDVSISAVLDPAVSADLLPDGFVTWTGGTAGMDQLTRLVAQDTPSITIVTCTVGATTLNVTVVIASGALHVRRTASGDSWGGGATVAAGGISNSVHEADIQVTTVPPGTSGCTFTVSIQSGQGQGDNGGAAHPSQPISFTTGSDGTATAIAAYLSSNKVENVTLQLFDSNGVLQDTATISQGWNNDLTTAPYQYWNDWQPITSTLTLVYGQNPVTIPGHTVKFYAWQVVYYEWDDDIDDYVQQTETISPANNWDLSSFSDFNPRSTTDINGDGVYHTQQIVYSDEVNYDWYVDQVFFLAVDDNVYQ